MVGETDGPLTPEQAKARLRSAAERLSPGAWVRGHPWQVSGLAMVAGFIAARIGSNGLPPGLHGRMLSLAVGALPLLLRSLR